MPMYSFEDSMNNTKCKITCVSFLKSADPDLESADPDLQPTLTFSQPVHVADRLRGEVAEGRPAQPPDLALGAARQGCGATRRRVADDQAVDAALRQAGRRERVAVSGARRQRATGSGACTEGG